MKKLKEDRSIPFAHTDNFIETKKKGNLDVNDLVVLEKQLSQDKEIDIQKNEIRSRNKIGNSL